MNTLRVITLALVLVCSAIPAMAHHKNAVCALPEEILDEVSPNVPVELKMVKLDHSDMLQYVGILFTLLQAEPPFDLKAIKGGVFIYSEQWPSVYVGLIDGPNGEVCHATSMPIDLHTQIVKEMLKGRS